MDVKNIVERLGAEEAVRKMAAFQLQNNILVLPPWFPFFVGYRPFFTATNLRVCDRTRRLRVNSLNLMG
jgi:hypothetical protein